MKYKFIILIAILNVTVLISDDSSSIQTDAENFLNSKTRHTKAKKKQFIHRVSKQIFQSVKSIHNNKLEDSIQDINTLIILKNKFENSKSIFLYQLSLDIQKIIDIILFNNIYKNYLYVNYNMKKFKKYQTIPEDEVLLNMLEKNKINKKIFNNYTVKLNGQLGKYNKKNNISYQNLSQIQNKKSYPKTTREYLNKQVKMIRVGVFTNQNVYDYIFSKALISIDDSQDIRIICKILLNNKNKKLENNDFDSLIKNEIELKKLINTSIGKPKTTIKVKSTLSRYLTKDEEYFYSKIILTLAPYFESENFISNKNHQKIAKYRVGMTQKIIDKYNEN